MAYKFNMNPLKTPMPTQDPEIRNGNFKEVALGYTEEQAMEEAKRGLNCKNRSCVSACPVNIKIPEFITFAVEFVRRKRNARENVREVLKQVANRLQSADWNVSLPTGTMQIALFNPYLPPPTDIKLRLSAVALQGLLAQAIWRKWATTLPCLKRST